MQLVIRYREVRASDEKELAVFGKGSSINLKRYPDLEAWIGQGLTLVDEIVRQVRLFAPIIKGQRFISFEVERDTWEQGLPSDEEMALFKEKVTAYALAQEPRLTTEHSEKEAFLRAWGKAQGLTWKENVDDEWQLIGPGILYSIPFSDSLKAVQAITEGHGPPERVFVWAEEE